MMLVADASVVIKWFVREELHAEATALLVGENELYAPDLLLSEIANVAWKKTVRGEIHAPQATQIVAACLEGVPSILPSANFVERALQMALALDHSVYDCLYLACAEMIGGVLVTSDVAFCRQVQRTAWTPFVRRLGSGEAGG
jgi:predicted nucleic acid-binding protein